MQGLVMCDLDGTIFFGNRGAGFAPGIKEVFAQLRRQGVQPTVNTARHIRTARMLAATLSVEVPYACLTGAAVLAAPPLVPQTLQVPSIAEDAEILSTSSMTARTVRKVFERAMDQGLGGRVFYLRTIGLYGAQELYTPLPEDMPIRSLEEIEDGALQMFVTGRSAKLSDVLATELREMATECNFYAFKHDEGFEIAVNPPAINKARLIDYYVDELGVPAKDIMAIGDSPGDAPMIERAGIGIATALAPAEVKAVADIVLDSAEYDAVPRFLRKYYEL